jgi:hypothetical protein
MYVHLVNGVPEKYSVRQLYADNPQVSFPESLPEATLAEYNVFPLQESAKPSYNKTTHKVVEVLPVQQNGQWAQAWDVVPLGTVELAEAKQQLLSELANGTQQRLDDFARTRGYDNITSGTTYASSTVQQYQQEGQYCVTARDQTWQKLYEILAEIEAGTRPMPVDFAEVEAELPMLIWPN